MVKIVQTNVTGLLQVADVFFLNKTIIFPDNVMYVCMYVRLFYKKLFSMVYTYSAVFHLLL